MDNKSPGEEQVWRWKGTREEVGNEVGGSEKGNMLESVASNVPKE